MALSSQLEEMKSPNSFLNFYFLIISIVGIIGIVICIGIVTNTLLEFFLWDEDGYWFKQNIIEQSIWLIVFGILFGIHFPKFLKLNKKTD